MRRFTLKRRGEEPDPLARAAYLRLFAWNINPDWGGDWDSLFMRSAKSFRLAGYLDRYCRGMTDGFSVLLAGQRGAGKTTLVKLLIQDAFLRSEGLIPLPIFLHGPTVIDPQANEPRKREDQSGGGEMQDATPLSVTINIGAAPAAAADAPSSPDDPFKEARAAKVNALPRMIAAMHGCLTDTICEAWRNAASQSLHRQRRSAELLEIAAHLDRMLELAPVVEPLRKMWRRGGFLRNGVAQYLRAPDRVAGARRSLTSHGMVPRLAGRAEDQGVREIVALVASSDAYRGVLGTNTDRFSSTRSAQEQRQGGMPGGKPADGKAEEGKSDDKSKQEKKEAGAKVGPAAVGAGVAALTLHGNDQHSLVVSALIGIVAWSASWFVWNYSISRTSTKSLTRESSFVVNWSAVAVLERRFPILLQRIKDAGFAPIFVLDELDKLDDHTGEKLSAFLTLTKHIVADHAAFFFLVNRDYYEELERRDRGLVSEPGDERRTRNAVERTFYTEREFVIYEPRDYRTHTLRQLDVVFEGGGQTAKENGEARIAIEAWATSLIYRSHLLLFDFRRRFFALFDRDGALREDLPSNPLTSPAECKAITLQIGIEVMVARPSVRARIDESPYYARLIYDTFYFLDTLEQNPERTHEITSDALNAYLAELSGTNAAQRPGDLLGRDTLFAYLSDYAALIADPVALRREFLTLAGSDLDQDSREALIGAIDEKPLIWIGADV